MKKIIHSTIAHTALLSIFFILLLLLFPAHSFAATVSAERLDLTNDVVGYLSIAFFVFTGLAIADNEGTTPKASESAPVQMISLSGTVVDFNSGEALTGVEISLEGTDIKVYTDFDGNFEIVDVEPGNYNIIASYISYDKSLVENFKADTEKESVEIKLQESN